MFYSTKRIDLQISFSAAAWLRIAQVIGLGFLFVPITLVAYIGIPPEKNNAVAGIVNFMRNMGSSVGTSLVTTLIARRSQFHQARLVQNVRADNPNFQNSANGLAQQLADLRIGQARGADGGLRQDLSRPAGAGGKPGIHRYLHGSCRGRGDHVLSGFCFEEE